MTREKAAIWIKLDSNWLQDIKIIDFRGRYGKAALVDVIQLFILMQQYPDGLVDMTQARNVANAELIIGKKGKALYKFLDRAAECGLIDAGLWESFRHVTSNRAATDAMRRTRQREGGRAGGKVSRREGAKDKHPCKDACKEAGKEAGKHAG